MQNADGSFSQGDKFYPENHICYDQGKTKPNENKCTFASWITTDLVGRKFTFKMDTFKHKEKWEGKHKLRIKHTVYDTGNPVTGY